MSGQVKIGERQDFKCALPFMIHRLAYSMIAWTHAISAYSGWGEDPAQDLEKAEEMINKAFEANPSALDAINVSTYVYILKGQYDLAIQQGEIAVEKMPSVSDAYAFLAYALLYAGRPKEAITEITKAMRLAPYYPVHFLGCLGEAFFLTGRYQEAEIAIKKRLERDPGNVNCLVWLAVINSAMLQRGKARTMADEVLRSEPAFSLKKWRVRLHYRDTTISDRIITHARETGLPL